MKHAEDTVENDPDQRNEKCCIVVRDHDISSSCLDVVLRKLFLAPRTFKTRGEESRYHFDNEHRPHDIQNSRHLLDTDRQRFPVVESVSHIRDQNKHKKHRPVYETYIMPHAYLCQLSLRHTLSTL